MLKTCKICGEEKNAVPGTWVIQHGKAVGRVCSKCNAKIALAKYHADPLGKEKHKETSRKARASPEVRAKANEVSRNSYATPEGKARVNASVRRSHAKIRATEAGRLAHNAASKAASAKMYANPERRLKANARVSAWFKANRDVACGYTVSRRAAKLRRTVGWADIDKIAEFYTEAARLTSVTGTTHTVDHVVPLRGKLVSGLHVHTNLQILTGSANSSKGNKWVP